MLGDSAVTNTGPTVVLGNVGISPGPAGVTGFSVGNGTVTPPYAIYENESVAAAAQAELNTAFNNYFAMAPGATDLTGQDLGTIGELLPGTYQFDSSAGLTGTLTLNAQGNPDAVFIIITGSTLGTSVGSSVVLANGAQGRNVYWVVGSSATIGVGTTFVGQILALEDITVNNSATITCGAAWADTGAVTLDNNTISAPASEPCAFAVFGEVVGPDATPSEEDIAGVIDDYVDGGGELPVSFQELLDLLGDLTPEEITAVFAQLSGEIASGVAPTGTQAMNSFLSLVLNSGSAPGSQRSGPRTATVKALGYVDTTARSPAGSAIASFDNATGRGTLTPGPWDVWVAVFGGESNTDGSSSAGTHDRSSNVFGIAGGFDFYVTADSKVGIAFAGGGTEFGVSDSLGSGSSNMFQTAIYSRTDFDKAYFTAALAYGYHDVSTDRDVTLPAPSSYTEHLSADFSAHNVAAQVEAGYKFGWLTPYGAARVQAFYTPDYSETSDSLLPGFALDHESNTATTVRTELGARMEQTFALQDGASLTLRSRIAWAHDFWYNRNNSATFQSLPGSSSFTVPGAEPATDSLLLSAGMEIGFSNAISLAGWFDSEFAEGSETYSGNAKVSYTW